MSVFSSQGALPFYVRNVLDACGGYTLVLRRFNVPLNPHANGMINLQAWFMNEEKDGFPEKPAVVHFLTTRLANCCPGCGRESTSID